MEKSKHNTLCIDNVHSIFMENINKLTELYINLAINRIQDINLAKMKI